MAGDGPFGLDPEDLDRVVRGLGDQLRGTFGQFGGMFDSAARRPRPAPEAETVGDTGGGVWMIYTVKADGDAQVEQVYATELDALRANKHNTDTSRSVRFLPYGMPISVLDAPEQSPED